MTARKRSIGEVASPAVAPVRKEITLIDNIRNMWQFANLGQWIFFFGHTVKLDENLDIEMLETECLKPGAPGLKDLGLVLLKFLSSHRGLNLELFDEYTRRQYLSKAPRLNPFGDDKVPASFSDFDVLTKIKVLQQLTVFAMASSEKLREKTEEPDQTQWRIEPFGWDSDDRTYFLLDDNRLYRQTEPLPLSPPPVKPSKKTKAGRASLRKRRRTTAGSAPNDGDDADADDSVLPDQDEREPEDNGIGGRKWECIVITLDQLNKFLDSIRKSRDDNEQVLLDRLEESLLPILEKQEMFRQRKEQARERELLSMAKMANAKRSSRLAGKVELQRIEQQAREEEEKRRADELAAKRKEAAALKAQQRMAMDREQRLQSRQDRIQERQTRRLQHEQDLARLSGSEREDSSGRLSQRRLKAEIEKNKQVLQELEDLEDDWIFDCVCGVYGQVDDGTHSISCERCNTWQHSACLGISEQEAEAADFNFVCQPCRKREQAEASASQPITTPPTLEPSPLGPSALELPKDADAITLTSKKLTSIVVANDNSTAPASTKNARRESLAKNATLFPPPPAEDDDDGLPVIPVKKAAAHRPSIGGGLPRPILTDITTSTAQTPTATSRTINPLSSSPPMKLAPAIDSSPYLGPSKANMGSPKTNGSPTLPPIISTPVNRVDHQRGFPPSTPLGGTSPTGPRSMAPLPPSENGLSPTKHSSPIQRSGGANGFNSSFGSDLGMSPTRKLMAVTQSPIVPPSTTLVPSPPPQINTPPQKNPTPVRP